MTYYGSRLNELYETHVYGDYETGKLWGFRYENGQVVEHRELADSTQQIVGFGEDCNGEFYFLDYAAGTIHRLVPNSHAQQENMFPRKLSESGVFTSVAQQVPAPGVIAYSSNAQPWEDHAVVARFVAVHNGASVKAKGEKWSFPKDSVLVKTFSLDMQTGNPLSRRLVETQILHFDGNERRPYTYRWNNE